MGQLHLQLPSRWPQPGVGKSGVGSLGVMTPMRLCGFLRLLPSPPPPPPPPSLLSYHHHALTDVCKSIRTLLVFEMYRRRPGRGVPRRRYDSPTSRCSLHLVDFVGAFSCLLLISTSSTCPYISWPKCIFSMSLGHVDLSLLVSDGRGRNYRQPAACS